MIKNPTNRDKNWQKEALWTNDKVQTIMPIAYGAMIGNDMLSRYYLLKVQGLRPKEVRVKIGKVGSCKIVRMEPEGNRREYPEASYLFSFQNQNFSGFLFGRDKFYKEGI
jgi:hypothetical protein